MARDMQAAVARWHEVIRSRDVELLGQLIAEDCTFLSPVVHTPQRGREKTLLYLTGAMHVLSDGFTYAKEVVQAPHAVLEFTCRLGDIEVNGVDIITFDEAGQIVEFKVMVRPLKAINALHEQMRAMLEQIAGAGR
jgi:hypothetical protein